MGASNRRIIVHHILPNAILTETALSFRGFGVQPSTASWGNMLNAADSIEVIQSMPWIWIPPVLAVTLTVLAINLAATPSATPPTQTITPH